MSAIKEWIMTIAGAVIILGLIDMILPSGKTKKTVAIVSGFIMTAVMVIPVFKVVSNIKNQNFFNSDGLIVEQERDRILSSRDLYTEEQLAQIAESYKSKLNNYVNTVVSSVPGVAASETQVIIKEDYTRNNFGEIEKIYVSALKGEPEATDSGSRLGKVKKIDRIVIDGDGIKIEKSGDDPPPENEDPELMIKISQEIASELKVSEDKIYVDIKK